MNAGEWGTTGGGILYDPPPPNFLESIMAGRVVKKSNRRGVSTKKSSGRQTDKARGDQSQKVKKKSK